MNYATLCVSLTSQLKCKGMRAECMTYSQLSHQHLAHRTCPRDFPDSPVVKTHISNAGRSQVRGLGYHMLCGEKKRNKRKTP